MSTLDQEYTAYVNSVGDGTELSFEDWKVARESVKGAVPSNLTAEDVAYIRYTDAKGDATPMGFQEWKDAGKPTF